MLGTVEIVGIVELVFYVPIVPLCFYLWNVRAAHLRRVSTLSLLVFSFVRLLSSILTLVAQRVSNGHGSAVAAQVFFDIGIVMLFTSANGLLEIIYGEFRDRGFWTRITWQWLEVLFWAVFLLLLIGCSLAGSATGPGSTLSTGMRLLQIGYIVAIVSVAMFTFLQRTLSSHAPPIPTNHRKAKILVAVSTPFLAIRAIYGTLSAFAIIPGDSYAAYAVMALLMEYIAACLYITAVFAMSGDMKESSQDSRQTREARRPERSARRVELGRI